MKAYQIEFRQKIIKVYEKEKLSIRKLAKRFNVTKSFTQKILKQYQQTGDIRPQKPGGSPPTKLQEEHLISLIEILEKQNDLTLEELSEALKEKEGIKVSIATMYRVTQKLGYSTKKKHFMPPKNKASEFRKKDLSLEKR